VGSTTGEHDYTLERLHSAFHTAVLNIPAEMPIVVKQESQH